MSSESEEREQELLVLESIYDTNFEKIDDFNFLVTTDFFKIKFCYTERYPNEIPDFSFEKFYSLEENEEEELVKIELEKFVLDIMNDNLGMAMIFSVVEATNEHLQNFLNETRQKRENDEENRKRKVSLEKGGNERFMEEMRLLDLPASKLLEARKGKLTGRQQFEKDKTLINSDTGFMGENDVEVDLDLFDGLDLGSDQDEENEVLKNFTEDD
ncbi:hypothetical protein HK099_006659 [Clydaea vesicula]|uniref:RWD domain-containing protein n=1 Tax=Clydaea vesicula TaxID=447962 RepID=A0AAD5U5W4_9FUNG|nr:hypothetical protein HK099_006659 [Clydaea vesicula]